MRRRDFLTKILAGGVGLAGLKAINPNFVTDEEEAIKSLGPRTRALLDFDWHFQLGDIPGAQAESFEDDSWRILDLPHDWSIEGNFNKDNPSSWHGAYLPGGIGWYRKELSWDDSWERRKVFIEFDGIYMNSDVWINGNHLGHWPYGFTTFQYELTKYLKKGTNAVAVRVDNSKQPSARWYTGSGINRHVWLEVANPVHIDHWGTFVTTPEIAKDSATVKVQTQIVNDSSDNTIVSVEQAIQGRDGRVVAHTTVSKAVKAGKKLKLVQKLVVHSPELWSPESPNMYEVETALKVHDMVVDRYRTPFGIRKIEYSSKWGFRLNEQPLMIKGVANHEDGGGAVGSAIPDDVLYHRLKRLKEIGCNAVRTAHNPHRPELYTFCDLLGVMVLDEAFDTWTEPKANSPYDYGLYFRKWWRKDLGNMIKRDRNHPSVVMWSIGNEVRGFTEQLQLQKILVNFVRRLDPTRPITQARGWKGHYVDIAGFNGEGEEIGVIKKFHDEHPDKTVLGTEMPHTRQTRCVYRTITRHLGKTGTFHPVPDLSDEEVFKGIPEQYCSSYDNDMSSIDVRDQYIQNKKYPFMMGSFRWTGYGYLGEANYKWPSRSYDKGVFDLAGLSTDHYYLYQSLWTERPMVHLLPHWIHPGLEGTKIPVVAYTNCKSVELIFNERSLGEQEMGEALQLVWQVPYRPGKLRALAKDENGTMLAETSRQTAGPAYKIIVIPDKITIRANRRDVVRLKVMVTDKAGVLVPDDDSQVTFEVDGPCKLIGVENGDVLDLNPTKNTDTHKVFKGKCIALVQATDRSGSTEINVCSKSLKCATVKIDSL